MNAYRPDSAQVDGEIIDLWVRRTGFSFQVRGTFRNRSFTGKGGTASAAKADWIKQAEYEGVECLETLDAEQNQISRKKVRFTALLAGLPFLVLGTLLYFFAGGQDPHGLGMSCMILGALSALLFYAIPGIPESFKKLFANPDETKVGTSKKNHSK